MRKITIYLKDEELKQVKKECQKYQVSISTYTDRIVFNMVKIYVKTNDDEKNTENGKKLTKEYIYKISGNHRSTVKPKIFDNFKNLNQRTATNCLKMYINNNLDLLFKKKETRDKLRSLIDNDLKKTYDRYYNYNETLRNTIRIIKENKDYIDNLKGKMR